MNLNELSQIVHQANKKWWQDIHTGEPIKRNKGELLALVHSEISEGFEGEINGDKDDKLPHRLMGEVEQVDALIRLLDYSAGFNHNLNNAAEKLGISEFIDLNHLKDCVRQSYYLYELKKYGLSYVHLLISRVLENERKGRLNEVPHSIVDLISCIVTYCSLKNYDIQGAFDEKMNFNSSREDHTHEARRIAGGKQF